MKKEKKINYVFASVISMAIGLVTMVSMFYSPIERIKTVSADTILTTLPDEISFVAEKMSQPIVGVDSGKYVYKYNDTVVTKPDYNNANVIAQVENSTDSLLTPVLLNNYQKTTGASAELVYFKMGDTIDEIKNSADGSEVTFMTITSHYLTVNGENVNFSEFNELYEFIDTNQEISATTSAGETTKFIHNSFELWLDLSQYTTEGQYDLTFNFSYLTATKDGSNYINAEVYTGQSYTFSFLLIGQESYATLNGYNDDYAVTYNNYPEFVDYTDYKQDSGDLTKYTNASNVLNYFYNFSSRTAPRLQYNAELYNISYTYVKDNVTTYVTSNTVSRTENGNTNLYIDFYENGTLAKEILVSPTLMQDGTSKYIATLEFTEFGSYEFTYLYQTKLNDGTYYILSDIEVDYYQMRVTHSFNFISGKAVLDIYGTKAYFNKTDNNGNLSQLFYEYEDENDSYVFNADYTSRLNAVGYTLDSTTTNGISSDTNLYADYIAKTNSNPIYDSNSDKLIPSLNLAPINFVYYGTATKGSNGALLSNYSRFASSESTSYISNKVFSDTDSSISNDNSGFYVVEMIYNYTSYFDSSITLNGKQYFLFEIISGQPNITTYTTDTTSKPNEGYTDLTALATSRYTSKNIVFGIGYDPISQKQDYVEYNYFCKPITTEILYGGSNYSENYTSYAKNINSIYTDSPTYLTSKGCYKLVVSFGSTNANSKTFSFTIDKDEIENISVYGVTPKYESATSTKKVAYVKGDIINENILSEYFGLDFDQKASGAKISVQYQKMELSNTDDYNNLYTKDGKYYITTNIALNLSSINANASKLAYNYSLSNGLYSLSSVLKPTVTSIYYFYFTDEAGHTATYVVLYDNSTPYIYIDPTPSNIYNIVSATTNVYWGNYKAISVLGSINDEADDTTNNDYYLSILEGLGLNNATTVTKSGSADTLKVLPIEMGNTTLLKASVSGTTTRVYSALAYATLNATLDGSDDLSQASFVGEATYKISSLDSLNNATATTVEMNFDNSMSMVFSGTAGSDITQMSTDLVKVTNSNALYFSYLYDIEGYTLSESDVQYVYFPISQSAYASVKSLSELNALTTMPSTLTELNDLSNFKLSYPYILSDATWETISIDSTFDQTHLCSSNGTKGVVDSSRVVSSVINPTSINGETCSKAGLYVIKRTYNNTSDENLGNDKKVKYFVVKVDRSDIIDIDPSSVTTDLNGNKTYDLEYYFQNGADIRFTLGSSIQSYLDALNIETYLSDEKVGDKFSTNRIPLKISIPTNKYNTYSAFSNLSLANDNLLDSTTLNSIVNAYDTFTIESTLVYKSGGINTTLNYTVSNGNMIYNISSAGTYELTIAWVAQGAGIGYDTLSQETFSFEVAYAIPNATFTATTERNSITSSTLGVAPITQDFTYTSASDALYYEFDDYDSTLEAKVNISNVKITTPKGSYTLGYNSETSSLSVNGSVVTNNGIWNIDESMSNNSRTRYYINIYAIAGFSEGTYTAELTYYDYPATYKNISTIVVDTTRPTVNINSLKSNDKYYTNKEDIDTTTYFFAVDQDTTLTNLGSRNETQIVYFRKIANVGNTTPEYTQITNFNPSLVNVEGLNYQTRNWSAITDEDGNVLDTTTYSTLLGTDETSYGYYEIVEADEAGNYVIYAIYYNEVTDNRLNDTIINITYNDISILDLDSQEQDVSLPNLDQEFDLDISGSSIKLGTTGTYIADAYYKIAIKNTNTGATLKTFSFDPNSEYSDYDKYFEAINAYITSLENQSNKTCYNFTIVLVNRFGEDFTITYRIPSEKLVVKPVQKSATTFSVTIPTDSLNSTEIVEFRVYKFMNNSWTELSQDNSATPKKIENTQTSNISLSGLSYLFNSGMYMITYVDNFGRDDTIYYGIGVGTTKDYAYLSGSITINNVSYTAGTVQLKYESSAYQCIIKYYDTALSAYVAYVYDASSPFKAVITENSGIRTVTFTLLKNNNLLKKIRFKVSLIPTSADTTDQAIIEANSDVFEITYELQELSITNLSGIEISGISHSQQSPTELSEDIYIVWDDEDMFGATVKLTNLTTNVSTNIDSNHKINTQGLYKVEITNGLGYTSSDNTIYFRRIASSVSTYEVVAIDNGTETSLIASPVQQIYTNADNEIYPVSIYYALDTYGEPTYVGAENENTRDKYILIRSNSSKNLSVTKITDSTLNGLYRITGTATYGYEKYIQIITIPETEELFASNDDIMLIDNDNTTLENLVTYSLATTSNVSSSSVTLRWKSYYEYEADKYEDRIYADMYFDGTHIRTIYSTDATTLFNEITMTSSGYYEFYFYDLAGNNTFTISNTVLNKISFYIVNSVMFVVNDEVAIDNQIFNGDVAISLTNRSLYEETAPVEVVATRNGTPLTVSNIGSGNDYKYSFSGQGRYVVTVKAFLKSGDPVTTTYHFIIINANQKLSFFDIPSSFGFTIVKIIKGYNTYPVTDNTGLTLSSSTTGTGKFTITLQAYLEDTLTYKEFTFVVEINDEVPTIACSVDYGTNTTDTITITYNRNIIYGQIGESYITVTTLGTIYINENTASSNARSTLDITKAGTYWIQLYTADGNLVASYKVIKSDPLNSTAIFIIAIVIIAVIILAVLFVILRKRLKVR